jgi:uncharacterized protein YqiB (DUF1249 family)
MKLLPDLARQRLYNRLNGEENLTALHEELYRQLQLLLPAGWQHHQRLESRLPGKPVLRLEVRERFAYTDEIALSYAGSAGEGELMVVRLYHDAKVAELHHCNTVGWFLRRLGPAVSIELQAGTRSSQNVFLVKWLDFLLDSGYQHRPWCVLDATTA